MNDDNELRLLCRINGLLVENRKLREALKPFADEADRRPWLGELNMASIDCILGGSRLVNRDLLNARAALAEEPKPCMSDPLTKDWVESWDKGNLEAMSGHDLEMFKDLALQGLDAQVEIEQLREALKQAQVKFQQETLRSAKCFVLLRTWIQAAYDIYNNGYSAAIQKSVVNDTAELLAAPINLAHTQETKP